MSACHEKKYLGKVWITVIRCAGLRKVQNIGEQDPYVEIEVNGKKHKTKTMHDIEFNPEFGERFMWDLENVESPEVFIRVWNENTMVLDDVIGDLRVPLCVLLAKENKEQRVPLFRSMNRQHDAGTMFLKVEFFGEGGLPRAPKASRYGILTAKYGTFELSADVAGVLENKVASMKLDFVEDVPLRDYFGFDALAGGNKHLVVSYLGADGKVKRSVVDEEHDHVSIALVDWAEKKAEAEKMKFEAQAAEAKRENTKINQAREEALQKAKEEAKARAEIHAEKERMQKAIAECSAQLAAAELSLEKEEDKVVALEAEVAEAEAVLSNTANLEEEIVKLSAAKEGLYKEVDGLKPFEAKLVEQQQKKKSLQKEIRTYQQRNRLAQKMQHDASSREKSLNEEIAKLKGVPAAVRGVVNMAREIKTTVAFKMMGPPAKRTECVGPIWGNYEAATKANNFLAKQMWGNDYAFTGQWYSKGGTSYCVYKRK
mmetsp:Transcript_22045/g.44239  ORF Transcript_22045/g.44239 Transcript_22045/m.44239 type:complete len:485 (-) Transcript_22045:170-1624(-)